MPRAAELMQKLFGDDIYAGYSPEYPLDLQGWNSNHPAFKQIISQGRIATIFDVGVWKGGSTIALAKLLQDANIDGVVVAIDTFLGSAEHWNRNRPDRIFESLHIRQGLPRLYFQFLSNVLRSGVRDVVVPLPQTSENATAILKAQGAKADLVHIDAAHDHDTVLRDARAYWELLNPNGFIVGDDFHPTWPGVVSAASEFAKEVGISLEVHEPKWLLKKPV